ncbi:MAG TPA: zinc-finger-containing protein [Longimicrobium sp.]
MARKPRHPPVRRRPSAPTCPYCGAPAEFLPNSESLYHGRDFGPVYACLPCKAWVGCHRGTAQPLGRLADAALRRAKIEAHNAFDRTWRDLHARRQLADPGYALGRARASRYRRLAELLGIPPQSCHIGMFDVETCRRVVALCASGALEAD